MSHRVTSRHVETLADGRMVEPGQKLTKFDGRDPHNKQLLERGAVTADPSPKRTKPAAKPQKKEDDK